MKRHLERGCSKIIWFLLALGLYLWWTTATASDLPQVAPSGVGTANNAPGNSSGLQNRYQQRLDSPSGITSPSATTNPPGSATLYRTPSGARTDTGTTLTGPQGGAMRDSQGGVWNCTGAGCFSPDGEFKPMYKTPSAVAPGAKP